MTKLSELHEAWSEDPEYRAEYERLGPQFALAHEPIDPDAGEGGARDRNPASDPIDPT